MTARAYRLDAEAQLEDRDRAESRDAARFDKRDLTRIGGLRYDADRVPHESDVEWGDES